MKYTIADILHLAADKYLAVNYDDYNNYQHKRMFSCCAIETAVEELYGWKECFKDDGVLDIIKEGLTNMGLNCNSFHAFKPWHSRDSAPMQQSRYAWLKFAALMAEEQGV